MTLRCLITAVLLIGCGQFDAPGGGKKPPNEELKADNCDALSLEESCELDQNDRLASTDQDGDGVLDKNDNCPSHANADQKDADGDGTGDGCDSEDNLDNDSDGIDNFADNCLAVKNPDQADKDEDGKGDACDAWPVSYSFSAGIDSFLSVSTDQTSVFVAGYANESDSSQTNSRWEVLSLHLGTAATAWQWERDLSTTGANEWAVGSVLDSGALFVLGRGFDSGGLCDLYKLNPDNKTPLWPSPVSFNLSSGSDPCTDLHADESGIYIVQNDGSSSRLFKRNKTDGSALWLAFPDADAAQKVDTNSTSYFVVGNSDVTKGDKTTGSKDWSKSVAGIMQAVAANEEGVFVAGASPQSKWIIHRLQLSDSSYAWTHTLTDESIGSEVHDLLMGSDGSIYLAGTVQIGTGNSKWRLEKRRLTDGEIVWQKEIDISAGDDHLHAMTLVGNELICVGRSGGSAHIEKVSADDGKRL